jgi:hypothetical protein
MNSEKSNSYSHHVRSPEIIVQYSSILVFNRKISLEFSHILTDGTGALLFLKALVAEYLFIQGIKPKDWRDIMRPGQSLNPEELEDAYKRYYKKDVPRPQKKESAFHIPGKLLEKGRYNIITGVIPLKPLLEKTKAYKVSLTEFISALYIFSLQEYTHNLPGRKMKKLLLIIPKVVHLFTFISCYDNWQMKMLNKNIS